MRETKDLSKKTMHELSNLKFVHANVHETVNKGERGERERRKRKRERERGEIERQKDGQKEKEPIMWTVNFKKNNPHVCH